jgi:hypothetical protein
MKFSRESFSETAWLSVLDTGTGGEEDEPDAIKKNKRNGVCGDFRL